MWVDSHNHLQDSRAGDSAALISGMREAGVEHCVVNATRESDWLEVFKQLPRDRILLETDAPDMLPPAEIITHPLEENHNHPANLAAIGRALAEAMEIHPQDLADLTRSNARACFGEFPG